jgi:hypothetical protein
MCRQFHLQLRSQTIARQHHGPALLLRRLRFLRTSSLHLWQDPQDSVPPCPRQRLLRKARQAAELQASNMRRTRISRAPPGAFRRLRPLGGLGGGVTDSCRPSIPAAARGDGGSPWAKRDPPGEGDADSRAPPERRSVSPKTALGAAGRVIPAAARVQNRILQKNYRHVCSGLRYYFVTDFFHV